RTARIGRAVTWMRAHIWLGLLCAPLLLLHSGFRSGESLSTWLSVLLVLVILSGVWGLILQNWLPRVLLGEVPSETVYAQIDHVVGQLHQEAAELVLAACGPVEGAAVAANGEADAAGRTGEAVPHHLTLGAQRHVGLVHGKVLTTRVAVRVEGAEPLR